jgi:hypothetical protein
LQEFDGGGEQSLTWRDFLVSLDNKNLLGGYSSVISPKICWMGADLTAEATNLAANN